MAAGVWCCALAAGWVMLVAGGCAPSLGDIDARTAELIRQRNGLLGAASKSPERAFNDGEDAPQTAKEKEPRTTNPAAGELTFTPADEARDVAARLEVYARTPDDALTLDLAQAWRISQRTAREYLSSEEEYTLAAIRLLVQRHAFEPQFFSTLSANITKTDTPGDANESVPLAVMNDLGVMKRFENGASVTARAIWNATEQLRSTVSGRYTQSSELVLSGQIPLLRGAGDVASAELIQAERDVVYAARTFEDFRRNFLVSVARDYFALVQQLGFIRNLERQLESLITLETRTKALVDSGRLPEFQTNIASNRVLQARSSLASQREFYILALDRFKVRLGLSLGRPVRLDPVTLHIPEPDIDPGRAAEVALEYRLDLQTRRDRADDARRAVEFAKNALLPDARLSGSITARTRPSSLGGNAPREGGFVYEPGDVVYQGGLTASLPLDRVNEQLGVRSATIALEQRKRDLDLARDNVIVEARQRTREVDRARFALTLAEQAVQINRRRLEEQELKRDEVTAQQIVETNDELLSAENARDQAVTDLRNAVLNYLISTGQLRVSRDGLLEALPGMGSLERPTPAASAEGSGASADPYARPAGSAPAPAAPASASEPGATAPQAPIPPKP